jgi:hypothetical protein
MGTSFVTLKNLFSPSTTKLALSIDHGWIEHRLYYSALFCLFRTLSPVTRTMRVLPRTVVVFNA